MSIGKHIEEHIALKVFSSDVIQSQSYTKEIFPTYPTTTISPHLVGFWPLNTQRNCAIRDTSGNGNHFIRLIQAISQFSGASGWAVNSNDLGGRRLSSDPLDSRYDIGAPGVSFILAFQTKVVTCAGGRDQTVLAKGLSGSGGALGLIIGMEDQAASSPRMRVVVNNSSKFSSNFNTASPPTWAANRIYHVAVVLDGYGAMGTAGRIYVYIDGVRDTAFDAGAGYTAFAPTAKLTTANVSFGDYGNNITGTDLIPSGINGYNLRYLQLALLQPNIPLSPYGTTSLASVDALIAAMAASPSHMLTVGDLP